MSGENTRFLDDMAALGRARVAAASAARPRAELIAAAAATPAPVPLSLSVDGFDLIMELKLSSPALGVLAAPTLDLEAQVLAYADAGAALVSVLTEPSRFNGELVHLERAARVLRTRGVPSMRKDFLVDPYQVYEARLYGASGVLLILRMLDDALLGAMLDAAAGLGQFVLLEAFDAADIERARRFAGQWGGAAGEFLIGVNSRDLQTLKVVPERLTELVGLLPAAHPRVAESGLVTAEDAGRLSAAGYTAALVGTALMSAADPVRLGRQMVAAGRDAARRRP